MTTVRDICTAALRRIRIASAAEPIDADDMAITVEALNRMLTAWVWMGLNLEHQAFSGPSDTFVMFVPPKTLSGATMAALAYQGTWDATANSPSLTSATGTNGYLYRVSTAGSTTLDDVTSWAANDFAVYSGSAWLKGKSSTGHERAVVDLLAVAIADEFGKDISPALLKHSQDGWASLQADYVRVDAARFDSALVRLPSRRLYGIME